MPPPPSPNRQPPHPQAYDLTTSNSTSNHFLGTSQRSWMNGSSHITPPVNQLRTAPLATQPGASSENSSGAQTNGNLRSSRDNAQGYLGERSASPSARSGQALGVQHLPLYTMAESPSSTGVWDGSPVQGPTPSSHSTPSHSAPSPLTDQQRWQDFPLQNNTPITLSTDAVQTSTLNTDANRNTLPNQFAAQELTSSVPSQTSQLLSPSASPQSLQASQKRPNVPTNLLLRNTRPRMNTDNTAVTHAHPTGGRAKQAPVIAPGTAPFSTSTNVEPGTQSRHPVLVSSGASGAGILAQFNSVIAKLRTRVVFNMLEGQRISLLRDACINNDILYLILHQIFCCCSISPAYAGQFGRAGFHIDGIRVLTSLLLANATLSRVVFQFFTQFPAKHEHLLLTSEFAPFIAEAKELMGVLATSWANFTNECLRRRYPPCSREISEGLSCRSIVLQRVFFNSIHRQLGALDHSQWQETALALFDDDQRHYYDQVSNEMNGTAQSQAFGVVYVQARSPILKQPPVNWHSRLQASSPSIPLLQAAQIASSSLPRVGPVNMVPTRETSNLRSTPSCSAASSHPPPTLAILSSGTAVSHSLRSSSMRAAQAAATRPASVPAAGVVQPSMSIVASRRDRGRPRLHPLPAQYQPQSPPRHSMPSPEQQQAAQQPPWPLLPPVGHTLQLTTNPNPDRVALHQAHTRSPSPERRCLAGMPNPEIRLYRYLDEFALKPKIFDTKEAFEQWSFIIPPDVFARKVKELPPHHELNTRGRRQYAHGTLLFQIRCAQLSPSQQNITESEWAVANTDWPEHMFLSTNDHFHELRRKSLHGRDLPVDLCLAVKGGTNQISMSVHAYEDRPPLSRRCAIAVEIIKVVDNTTARSMLSHLSAHDSLALITKTLNPSSNSESDELLVVDPYISIDLIDPFTSTILTTPVRGQACLHRECFDLSSFLLSRTSKHKDEPTSADEWKCPICKRDARPQSLVMDEFLAEVRKELEKKGLLEDTRAILVRKDGSWEPKMEKSEEKTGGNQGPVHTPATKRMTERMATPTEVIDLDSD